MKKIITTILILLFIIPAFVYAENPSDIEVIESSRVVLAVFGTLFLSVMFGTVPDGVEAEMSDAGSGAKLFFTDFDAQGYFESFEENPGDSDDYDIPDFYFDMMSGTVAVNSEGIVDADVNFKGGNIRTLKFQVSETDVTTLIVNGKKRRIDNFLE